MPSDIRKKTEYMIQKSTCMSSYNRVIKFPCLLLFMCAICNAYSYTSENIRFNFQLTDSDECKTPSGYTAVGVDPYDAEKGYGWFGTMKGAGWRLKGGYGGGNNAREILFSSVVQNVHAPFEECSGFRVDVPNGEYVLELGFGGDRLYGASWDIHVVGRRVASGILGPNLQKVFRMNVYVTNGFFAFGMSKSKVSYLLLTRISDKLPSKMTSKEINDFAPNEIVGDSDWRNYYSKNPVTAVPMDWKALRNDAKSAMHAINRNNAKMPITYWSDVPLSFRWESACSNVTVFRKLPFEFSLLEELVLRVKFRQPASGNVLCKIEGISVPAKLDASGYEAVICIRDSSLLKKIAEKKDKLKITIRTEKGDIGKYAYDTPSPVNWIPAGQDGRNFIVAVTFKALFKSKSKAYAVSKVALNMPFKSRIALPPAQETVPVDKSSRMLPSSSRYDLCLNGEWEFQTTTLRGLSGNAKDAPTTGFGKLRVPGTWSGLRRKASAASESHDNMDWVDKPCAWYRTKFTIPEEWKGRDIVLEIGMINYYASVSVNGEHIGEHRGIYRPLEMDITRSVRFGQENTLLLYMEDERRQEKSDQTYIKKRISDLGIRRDVWLRALPSVRIESCSIVPSVRKKSLTVATTIINTGQKEQKIVLNHTVRDAGKDVLTIGGESVSIPAGKSIKVILGKAWADPTLWDIDNPYLYFLKSEVSTCDGAPLDSMYTRFGFREFWIDKTEFRFNGKQFNLQGDSVIDYFQAYSVPHIRTMMAAARSANRNILRIHQAGPCQPYPEIADELGMLIMPENDGGFEPSLTPIDSKSQKPSPGWDCEIRKNLADCYRRTFNNPSVVIYSLDNELQLQATPKTWVSDVLVELEKYAKMIDSSRVYTHEGDFWLKDEPTDTINLHYVPMSWVEGWQQKYRRPLLLGEINGDPNPMNRAFESNDTAAWWRAARTLTAALEGNIKSYVEQNVPGIHPFELASYTRCPIYYPGPWGNLTEDVKVSNPSLSGPGIKLYRLGRTIFMGKYNWFDPAKPMMVPDIVFNSTRDALRPISYFAGKLSPEIIVQVCPDENVFMYPIDGQNCNPTGVRADSSGKAWFRLKEYGRYRIFVKRNDKYISAVITPACPGEWYQIKTAILED